MFAKAKNKKRLIVYIVLAVALIAAGFTYAWFEVYIPEDNVVELGELGIQGSFETDDEEYYYEPGVDLNPVGTVKNTGTLPFITKLSLTAESTLVRNTDGELLPAGQTIPRPEDPNVEIEFNEDELVSEFFDDGSAIIWTKDAAGDIYLILFPGLEVEVPYYAMLNGDNTGNEYMNATIKFSTGWLATQALEDAVKAEWGDDVDFEDMVNNVINPTFPDSGRSMFTTAAAVDTDAYIAEFFENLFNR